jgi:alpha-amylase
VSYRLEGVEASLRDYWFAPELEVNLLAPDAPDRFFLHRNEKFPGNNLGSRGDIPNGDLLSLVDDYLGVRINLLTERQTGMSVLSSQSRWVWYPVETISLSEGGIERVYQGSAILPMWRLGDLQKAEAKISLWVECWKEIL